MAATQPVLAHWLQAFTAELHRMAARTFYGGMCTGLRTAFSGSQSTDDQSFLKIRWATLAV
jgi:hypothetical protein